MNLPTDNDNDNDELRVLSWNIERGGRDADGRTYRRELATEIAARYRPHLYFRQEITEEGTDGASMYAEAEPLKLVPLCAPPIPENAHQVAVFIDPSLFSVRRHRIHTTRLWHPISNPEVMLHGTAKPVQLASVHLCSYDPATRATEAHRLISLANHRRSVLLAGDFNSYVHRTGDEIHPLPDWAQVEDRVHYQQRTVWREGERVSDTEPDRILADPTPHGRAVFTELGHHAGSVLGQHAALAPTASLWRKDQGTRQRIDRMYATPDLAPALRSLTVLATDDTTEASDHAPVLATFSLTTLRRTLTFARNTEAHHP